MNGRYAGLFSPMPITEWAIQRLTKEIFNDFVDHFEVAWIENNSGGIGVTMPHETIRFEDFPHFNLRSPPDVNAR